MKRFLFSALFVCVFLMSQRVEAQNCPWDWHPPPCGLPQPEPPPPAVTKAQKDAARRLQFYYAGNIAFLSSLGVIGGFVGGPIGAAGPLIAIPVASYKVWSWGTVVSDPWDPAFQEAYGGRSWPTLEELGFGGYTNYDSLNNLIWVAQAIVFYADFVYVSANRASSCQMAGVGCDEWQIERAQWGLSQMGNVMAISRDNHERAAWEASSEGNQTLAQKFWEIAEWDNWGAGEFQ